MRSSVKSLPIPVAQARHNFADILAQARNGQRIKLTRHGKNVAWIVGAADRDVLRQTASKHPRSRKK
ncbi:MAG TPA: type II toxin-antitoxin system prevent-host-death family antitoxin [Polyangiaceae bacterium]|jgi:prevent-host-death family protein|nr:type II toxin-antitoxin system prevent-host-death family antitoxin [Polyangiaceae bacterium]